MHITPKRRRGDISLKQKLLDHCKVVLANRINVAMHAMNQAQEAANSEGKSSAGDKYETSRAMGQLDRDMNARQLEEAQRDLAFINTIPSEVNFDSAQTVSVLVTEKFSYFISTGLGSVVIENQQFIFLSPSSPVAKVMLGKTSGEIFFFNGQSIKILDVY